MAALDPGSSFPRIDLRDERGGRAALPKGECLYAFFKTTCPTTELAWPFLERIRRLGEDGLPIVGVSQDDPAETAAFHGRLGVRMRTLFDPPPWRASDALGLTSVPTLFLVGEDGTIRDAVVGFQREKMEALARRAASRAGRPYGGLFEPGEDIPAIKPG